jgi:transcriptional regulator with XRE-family HTH domain
MPNTDTTPRPAFATPDEYAHWFNLRIGAEVRERREALGLSAYALAKVAGVSDQTILNMEQGICPNGCLTSTLARIALRFGLTLSELVTAAEGRP